MIPDSDLLPENIGDALLHIDMQAKLTSLSEQTFRQTLKAISQSYFLTNADYMSVFIEDVINVLSIRPKSKDLLVRLVGELITNPQLNPHKSQLKCTLLHAVFKPLGDWRFVLKIPLFLFLREFYIHRYLSLFDITEEIRDMLANDCKSPNVLSKISLNFFNSLL